MLVTPCKGYANQTSAFYLTDFISVHLTTPWKQIFKQLIVYSTYIFSVGRITLPLAMFNIRFNRIWSKNVSMGLGLSI